MTLDELTVKITVAADEAEKKLDKLIGQEKLLRAGFGKSYKLNADFGGKFDWLTGEMDGLRPDFSRWMRSRFDAMVNGLEREGVRVSAQMREVLWQVLNNAFSLGEFESFGDLERVVESTLGRMAKALKDPELLNSMETLMRYWDNMGSGMEQLSDMQRNEMSSAWKQVFDDDGEMVELLSDIPGITEMTAQSLLALGLNAETAGGMMETFRQELNENAEAAENTGDAFADIETEADGLTASLEKQRQCLREVLSQMAALGKESAMVNGIRRFSSEVNKGTRDGSAFERSLQDMAQKMREAGANTTTLEKGVQDVGGVMENAGSSMTASAGVMVQQLRTLIGWAQAAQKNMVLKGSASVDASAAISNLQRLIGVAQNALLLMRMLGTGVASGAIAGVTGIAGISGSNGSSGGGGGGSKKDKNAEAIEEYYRLIEHKKRLNQLSLEDELKMLDTLKSQYKLNAQQRMEWDEKVFEVKEAIRKRDAEQIDRLSDGIVDALEKRYDAMERAEMERLDASRNAWIKWRDDSVEAIEKQIDALDRLAESEERERKDAQELREIERLRQEMAYEQDDFNREMLRIQLEKALNEREERIRKEAIEDEKRSLESQMELIEKKAEEQLSALDEEEKRIFEYYSERTKAANLQAEAEKMILNANQKQMVELLTEYLPEYETLGQSMGERLVSGFMQKVSDITSWFETFGSGIVGIQQQMANASAKAAQSFYATREETMNAPLSGIVVNQNVSFNEPVESPAAVARRIEEVNDALGLMFG